MAQKTQIQKFRDAARAAEADQSEDHFNATLRRLGKQRRNSSDEAAEEKPPRTNKGDE